MTKTKYGGLSTQRYLFNSGPKVAAAIESAARYLHDMKEDLSQYEFSVTVPEYKRLQSAVDDGYGPVRVCYGLKLKVVDQDE